MNEPIQPDLNSVRPSARHRPRLAEGQCLGGHDRCRLRRVDGARVSADTRLARRYRGCRLPLARPCRNGARLVGADVPAEVRGHPRGRGGVGCSPRGRRPVVDAELCPLRALLHRQLHPARRRRRPGRHRLGDLDRRLAWRAILDLGHSLLRLLRGIDHRIGDPSNRTAHRRAGRSSSESSSPRKRSWQRRNDHEACSRNGPGWPARSTTPSPKGSPPLCCWPGPAHDRPTTPKEP